MDPKNYHYKLKEGKEAIYKGYAVLELIDFEKRNNILKKIYFDPKSGEETKKDISFINELCRELKPYIKSVNLKKGNSTIDSIDMLMYDSGAGLFFNEISVVLLLLKQYYVCFK